MVGSAPVFACELETRVRLRIRDKIFLAVVGEESLKSACLEWCHIGRKIAESRQFHSTRLLYQHNQRFVCPRRITVGTYGGVHFGRVVEHCNTLVCGNNLFYDFLFHSCDDRVSVRPANKMDRESVLVVLPPGVRRLAGTRRLRQLAVYDWIERQIAICDINTQSFRQSCLELFYHHERDGR